jgi:hypothetical protein
VEVNSGDVIEVASQIASADGMEYSRARVSLLSFTPADDAAKAAIAHFKASAKTVAATKLVPAKTGPALVMPRAADGDGSVEISGELKQWHNVTLTLKGPFANEGDNSPNPFTDYNFTVNFRHESGSPSYYVPGYFAADGDAGNSSAVSGAAWRAHLSPDKAGEWTYTISFIAGDGVALKSADTTTILPFSGTTGSFEIGKTDKKGRDFRSKGRLQYVGGHYLRFAGTGDYFLKAGPDAPETMLAYVDFDNTTHAPKKNSPLKTWEVHAMDWNAGDPTWKDGKGKGLIGALNYLAEKGVNSFSFLPYNAGGDGDNIWPFVERNDKFHYDVSKLAQWGVVFEHGVENGLHLHFKLQENEIDDNRRGQRDGSSVVPESFDGGKLGPERKLYLRELIARFSHNLALNWNIGEENTQSTEEIVDMVKFIHDTDPYKHNIVIHTFPNQQEKVYTPLLGNNSLITGASLQNHWDATHKRTLQWVKESRDAGRPWVVANDEQGNASLGVPPDPGYKGFSGTAKEKGGREYDLHCVRKHTLWGNLMAGGAGVEYYFGYQLLENDLIAEDFRSRDMSWDYCRVAIEFFADNKIPFYEMSNANALIGNMNDANAKYCFAKSGEVYLIYLSNGGSSNLDVSDATGSFSVKWFNPREGGKLVNGSVRRVKGGSVVSLGNPPADADQDWLVVVK